MIKHFNLKPHPEGGFYRETYRAKDLVTTAGGKTKSAATAIYYMLTDTDKSHFHRVSADEIWLFHKGEAIEIMSILEDGSLCTQVLGNRFEAGEEPQIVVPAHTWFAAKLQSGKGEALVSCIVAPGFDFADFELAKKKRVALSIPTLKRNYRENVGININFAKKMNMQNNLEKNDISWGSTKELILVIAAAVMAGATANLPSFLLSGSSDSDFFNIYARNISLFIFPFLIVYFLWKNKAKITYIIVAGFAVVVSVAFINLLWSYSEQTGDFNPTSSTFILSCIHLPLFLWMVLGFSYVSNDYRNLSKRIDFLKYNANLVVITALILVAGAILTAVMLLLFNLIDVEVQPQYILLFGLAISPIVATYLIQLNPKLLGKIVPAIAKIFSPFVLIVLVIYLVAMIFSTKNPYTDRDFLLIFNFLLIGVMAIILFSVAETSHNTKQKSFGNIVLFLLSIVTAVVNLVALSAILFRITEWGITPNRLAVLGSNVLILTNLLIVSYRLSGTIKKRYELDKVERSIAFFLPIYALWTIVVTFLFPLIFWFE